MTEKAQKNHFSAKRKRPRQSPWSAGGALQLAAALLWLPQAWFLAVAVGAMAQGEAVWATALQSAAWVLDIGIVRTGLDAWGARISFRHARARLSALRQQAIFALSQRSPLDINRPSSGQVASVLTEQAETIVPYLARYQPVQLKVMLVPLVFLVAVVVHSWVAALVLLCAAPLIPVFMILVGWRAKEASGKQMLEIGQMNGFLLDRLRGLATIRAFDAVDVIAVRLRKAADTVKRKTMVVLRVAFLSSAVLELFSALGVAMVAVYIGFHLLGELPFGAWGSKMSLTQGLFILLLAPTFFDPLRELSAVWHDRASGIAAMDAMAALSAHGVELVGGRAAQAQAVQDEALPNAQAVQMEQTAQTTQTTQGALSIQVKGLHFAFPDVPQPVFNGLDLDIRAAEKVAFVAPSGFGKSTLLALLAGLFRPSDGRIYLNDVLLDDETADRLRVHMGWISQQPHIFADTLLRNMTLGRAGVALPEVQAAIRDAAMADFAAGQLQRHLGEGGSGLSGGEALRLALARAMLTPGLGLLLADEPTAHLDTQTANEVIQGLMAVAKRGVTLVVATHDERLLPYMDKVTYLDHLQNESQAEVFVFAPATDEEAGHG